MNQKLSPRDLTVGDDIRVIPASFYDLSKLDLNKRNAFEPSDAETNETLMLGGLYKIRGIVHYGGVRYYQVLANPKYNAEVLHTAAVLASSVTLCPYGVGDEVVYQPTCSDAEDRFVRGLNTLKPIDDVTIHRVTKVINDYYILLDGEWTPFRWVDFVLAAGGVSG